MTGVDEEGGQLSLTTGQDTLEVIIGFTLRDTDTSETFTDRESVRINYWYCFIPEPKSPTRDV